jgi:hypothetical protein
VGGDLNRTVGAAAEAVPTIAVKAAAVTNPTIRERLAPIGSLV